MGTRLWHIPLTFTSVEESPAVGWNMTEPMEWLWQEEAADYDVTGLLSDEAPFLVNIQGVGYYRVNYDQENWDKLAEVLKTNRDWIHPLNRAQIICDVAKLAETGHVTMEQGTMFSHTLKWKLTLAPTMPTNNVHQVDLKLKSLRVDGEFKQYIVDCLHC